MIALLDVGRLLGLAALIHGFEFLKIQKTWGHRGPWAWPNLESELSPLSALLVEKSFLFLNIVRLFAASWTILNPNPWNMGALLLIHVLSVIRWLGSFNGGSDYMMSLLLLFTFIGICFPENMSKVSLWYITLQLVLSYFKAGWIKLKNSNWRNGRAIGQFVISPIYADQKFLRWLVAHRHLSLIISWATILFEILFPVAILNQTAALILMSFGLLFHLSNAIVFGLNRFVFAWAAAYPALYWCAGQIGL